MGVAPGPFDGHNAYLRRLHRTLAVGLVVSLALHAALVAFLPNPFEHPHPTTRELEVTLVQIPAPATPVIEAPKPPPEQPVQTPAKPAPAARPAPTRPRKLTPEPLTTPARPPPAAPALSDAVRSLPQTEPAQAAPAPPAVPASAVADGEKPAQPPSAAAKDTNAESETPPSFRVAYLRNPEPVYPAASRRLGEQGTAQLRVLVTADGRAARVDVHRSSGFARLDDAAAAAVREWRFVPAKRGTTPVEAQVIVPIVFRLEVE